VTSTRPEGAPVGYGTVLSAAHLASPTLPAPRGPLSAAVLRALAGPVDATSLPSPGLPGPSAARLDALHGEDEALTLYCLYELHYRGFAEVDERWEWEPALLALRRDLEVNLEARLCTSADLLDGGSRAGACAGPGSGGGPTAATVDIAAELEAVIAGAAGRSLSAYLAERGTVEQFRELAIHRSLFQLKEADAHSWAIPRLTGSAKAALVEIQADEYGHGVTRDMHQNLFGVTMAALGLDPSYGAYLDRVPATTLATVNIASMFGLHRRLRGALVGHLAVFEMTSVEPMSAYAAALRRLGFSSGARHFYEVHVVADAHHRGVASTRLAAGLVAAEPALAADVMFGARSIMAVEGACAEAILTAWDHGRSSLHREGPSH
jgi:hypothetical protein